MLKYFVLSAVMAMLICVPISQAKTPDGRTPAEETVCDELEGALYGLCVAYCEAMDCDHSDHMASDRACERVLTNFMKHSPEAFPPCMDFDDEGGEDPGEPGGSEGGGSEGDESEGGGSEGDESEGGEEENPNPPDEPES
ncbi:hypothetical protein [Candidatus Entotheonella palauensis]|uniref:Uncharacterized protein n=1 Tax=Candidatus Entotheonella gemina TaxID=1429439 RepID=W4M9Z6_9BACT|nr:hypothetical protein [Candidatus Entotheonella palauensis]ETX06726.1 MAG: hypothetical protein ETSY2_15390 [Candidatus Entotheonella gemina]